MTKKKSDLDKLLDKIARDAWKAAAEQRLRQIEHARKVRELLKSGAQIKFDTRG